MIRGRARSLSSYMADEHLRIVDADEDYVATLGYSRDVLIGRNLLDLTHEDDRLAHRDQLAALMSGGDPFSITKRYVAVDGATIWVTNHVTLFHAGAQRRMLATVEVLEEPPTHDRERALRLAAERMLASRRLRSAFFDGEMFGEPAFDLLLDLFVQELAGRQTYTGSAALASGAPLTTALRQIAFLVDKGLVRRASDPRDRRRVLLMLTPQGSQRMVDYLAAADAA